MLNYSQFCLKTSAPPPAPLLSGGAAAHGLEHLAELAEADGRGGDHVAEGVPARPYPAVGAQGWGDETATSHGGADEVTLPDIPNPS